MDSNDNNYVTDYVHNSVKKFTRTGNFISWGLEGTGDGQFMAPIGIGTFAADTLLVVDMLNNRIQEFSNDSIFITKWGSRGTQQGEFIHPIGVGINKTDSMHYISDPQNHRVQRFIGTHV